MNKIIRLLAFTFLATNVVFFTSCTEDDPVGGGGPTVTNPSITVTGVPFSDVTPGDEVTVSVSATPGTDGLGSIEVQRDGVRADANITAVAGDPGNTNNPFIVTGTNFSGDVSFEAPSVEGVYEYTFIARGGSGSTASGETSFTITVALPRPTVSIFGAPTDSVEANTNFTVTLDAIVGAVPLQELTITENGANLPVSRLAIAGLSSFGNPQIIEGTDKDGLNWEVTITAPSEEGTYEYVFSVSDENTLVGDDLFLIDVKVVGTPITETLTAKLLRNQVNTAPVGAMELVSGKQTGVFSVGEVPIESADIRDMSIDCTIPAPGFNWKRQIGTVNGADMRGVDLTQVENFTFDNVTFVEQIIAAYDTGIEFFSGEATTSGCSTTATITVTDVSDVVEVGDMFVVLDAEGNYYLLRADVVNETGMDNDDFYEFSIKY